MIDAPELIWKPNGGDALDVFCGARQIGRVSPVPGPAVFHRWEITGVQVDSSSGEAGSRSTAKRALAREWASWRSAANLIPRITLP